MESLRITQTHAAGDESAGAVWGLRYELLGVGLGGAAVSILILGLLLKSGDANWAFVALAALPGSLSMGFAIFRQTHPPGYDTDLLDLWLHGPGFGPKPPQDKLP